MACGCVYVCVLSREKQRAAISPYQPSRTEKHLIKPIRPVFWCGRASQLWLATLWLASCGSMGKLRSLSEVEVLLNTASPNCLIILCGLRENAVSAKLTWSLRLCTQYTLFSNLNILVFVFFFICQMRVYTRCSLSKSYMKVYLEPGSCGE